ncbi:hypothetical protein M8J76_007938 [Diaphorina citri]|nr:hypothetical protein M8J76_007938 [Diaphorina citri]
MVIYGVYIVSKSGGLIFNYDHNVPKIENAVTFQFPLNIKLTLENKKIVVSFGQRDGILVGHVLTAVNDAVIKNGQLDDGTDVLEFLSKPESFPVKLTFTRPRMTTNEKIFLASVKFMIVGDTNQSGLDLILKKIYELYADYALKNPFYSLEMPIRCELFDTHLQNLLQQHEKTGVTNV